MLELDPPLVPYTVYDEDVRQLYTSSGAEGTDEGRLDALRTLLAKMPRLHLVVLDALVQHLTSLIGRTKTDEADETYRAKLALSLGRCVARPKVDTALSLDDKSPARFFGDLLLHRDAVLPGALERRTKRESQRFEKPTRKRTAPVDIRLSRSQLGSDGAIDAEEAKSLLGEQLAMHSPPLSKSPSRTGVADALAPPPPPVSKSEQTSRSATPEFVDAPSQPVSDALAALEGHRKPSEASEREASPPIERAPPPPSHQRDPPFVPPSEERDPPFIPPSQERDPPSVPPTQERDPPFVPPTETPYTVRRSLDGERDQPFVPPTETPSFRQSLNGGQTERDLPFTPPIDLARTTSRGSHPDEDTPLSATPSLHRGPRIARGPRPPSIAGGSGVQRVAGEYRKRDSTGSTGSAASGRVAAVADRFGGSVSRSPQ